MSTQSQRRTFISYSRINKEFALKLALELRSSGFDIWLDQLDIPPGARWDDEVEDALERCEVFMVILTPASTASDNVKDEIGYAIDNRKRILPILLENATLPLRLRRFQYVDFTSKSFDDGVEGAMQLLKRLIDEPTLPNLQIPAPYQTQEVGTNQESQEQSERLAAQQAEADRKAKEEAERLTRQQVEEERIRKAEMEAQRLAVEKAEKERLALQKARQETEKVTGFQVDTNTSANEKQKVEAPKLATDSVLQKRESLDTPPQKKSKLPLIIGMAGVGALAVLVVVAVVIGIMFSGEIPVTAPTAENLPTKAQIGENPPTEPAVQQEPTQATAPTVPPVTITPDSPGLNTPIWSNPFVESFDDNANGWFTSSDETGSKSIANGNYVWDVQFVDGSDAWQFFNKDLSITDFDLRVDAKRIGGAAGELCYGLTFRATQKDLSGIVFERVGKYYELEICDNQTYLITYFDGNDWNYWQDWTDNNVIKPNDWNTLEVKVSGAQFEYYINDTKVAEFSDSNLAAGNVGLSVYSYDDVHGQIVFDNFYLHVK